MYIASYPGAASSFFRSGRGLGTRLTCTQSSYLRTFHSTHSTHRRNRVRGHAASPPTQKTIVLFNSIILLANHICMLIRCESPCTLFIFGYYTTDFCVLTTCNLSPTFLPAGRALHMSSSGPKTTSRLVCSLCLSTRMHKNYMYLMCYYEPVVHYKFTGQATSSKHSFVLPREWEVVSNESDDSYS